MSSSPTPQSLSLSPSPSLSSLCSKSFDSRIAKACLQQRKVLLPETHGSQYLLALAHVHVWGRRWAIITITSICTMIATSLAMTCITSIAITTAITTTITLHHKHHHNDYYDYDDHNADDHNNDNGDENHDLSKNATAFLTLNNATAVNDEPKRVTLVADIALS